MTFVDEFESAVGAGLDPGPNRGPQFGAGDFLRAIGAALLSNGAGRDPFDVPPGNQPSGSILPPLRPLQGRGQRGGAAARRARDAANVEFLDSLAAATLRRELEKTAAAPRFTIATYQDGAGRAGAGVFDRANGTFLGTADGNNQPRTQPRATSRAVQPAPMRGSRAAKTASAHMPRRLESPVGIRAARPLPDDPRHDVPGLQIPAGGGVSRNALFAEHAGEAALRPTDLVYRPDSRGAAPQIENVACSPLLFNDDSPFCRRSRAFEALGQDPELAEKTTFFSAASAVTSMLANKDLPLSGVSDETSMFLDRLSAILEKVNLAVAQGIREGKIFQGENREANDVEFVRIEQTFVEFELSKLRKAEHATYARIVGEINDLLNGRGRGGEFFPSLLDSSVQSALESVREGLGGAVDIDFGNQDHRVRIGDALTKMARESE